MRILHLWSSLFLHQPQVQGYQRQQRAPERSELSAPCVTDSSGMESREALSLTRVICTHRQPRNLCLSDLRRKGIPPALSPSGCYLSYFSLFVGFCLFFFFFTKTLLTFLQNSPLFCLRLFRAGGQKDAKEITGLKRWECARPSACVNLNFTVDSSGVGSIYIDVKPINFCRSPRNLNPACDSPDFT